MIYDNSNSSKMKQKNLTQSPHNKSQWCGTTDNISQWYGTADTK